MLDQGAKKSLFLFFRILRDVYILQDVEGNAVGGKIAPI